MPSQEHGDLAIRLWTPQQPLLSVPMLLPICVFLELEFSLFHLSSQHLACLSQPLSTSPLPSLQQPELRAGPPLSGNYDSFPGSRRKSLFFSLNVQVNFY